MIKLDFVPSCTEWIYSVGDTIPCLAVTDVDTSCIKIYDGQGTNIPMHTIDKLHAKPVTALVYNAAFDTVISVDKAGILGNFWASIDLLKINISNFNLEYWSGYKNNYEFPRKAVTFESKLDTSLYEFAKNKTTVTGLVVSIDGKRFAAISTDRKVRVFQFLSGKLIRVYDECLARFAEQQQSSRGIPNMEFGRRMANERDIEKTEALNLSNILFDISGHFILYSTMLGVKMVNIETNRCVQLLGKSDNIRPLHIALFQGKVKKSNAANSLEQEASENPTLALAVNDPILFCTAYKKQRFYMYTRRLPSDLQDIERDIFNEQPSKEDILAVTESSSLSVKIFENAILHTTFGDMHLKL